MADGPPGDHGDPGRARPLGEPPVEHAVGHMLVRLRSGRDDAVVGAGFLIGGSEILTCAHVVANALDVAPEDPQAPGGEVIVELPFLGLGPFDASVVLWRPVGDDPPEDVTVLRLAAPAPPPARPMRFVTPTPMSGRSFEVCGFPEGNDAGAWAEGRTGHRRADGTIQVGDPHETGYPIQPGFSGAPVWDVEARGVIGMVVSRERSERTKVAFVLPVDRLAVAWESLPVVASHDPFAVLTAGISQSLSALRQLLAEYIGLPGRPVAFGGRSRDLDGLDRWLEASEPYALLVAAAGRGKTALLAHWAAAVAAADAADVVYVPISVRFGTAAHAPAMRLLLERMRHALGAPGEFVADPTTWHSDVERFLEEAPADPARPLLVVLDGADEASGWELDKSLRFPVSPRPGLKVIVSARQTVDRDAQEWVDRLHWRGLTTVFDLDPLDRLGVEEVLGSIAADVGGLDLTPLADAVWRLTAGDPLEVQLYARHIVAHPDPASIAAAQLLRHPPGLEGFFELWWEDQLAMWSAQQRDDLAESQDVEILLGFAAVARGALSREDLAALGGGRLRGGAYLQRKLTELGRFLIPASQGGDDEGFVFAHPRLNVFFGGKPRMLGDQRRDIEHRLFTHCRASLQQVLAGDTSSSVSRYAVRFLGVHAEAEPGESATLYSLVDAPWHAAWQELEGGPEGFLGDVERARRRADAEVTTAATLEARRIPLEVQIRCALVVSSLTTQAQGLEPELLAALVEAEVWAPQIALEYALRPNSEQSRIERLTAILELLPPRHREDALAAVTEVTWPMAASFLMRLLDRLSDEELGSILTLGRAHDDAVFEAVLLGEQARRTTGEASVTLALEALDRILHTDAYSRGWALAVIADLLPAPTRSSLALEEPDLYVVALDAEDGAGALMDDVPQEAVLPLAQAAAQEDGRRRYPAVAGRLLARLPDPERGQLLGRFTTEYGSWERTTVLVALADAASDDEFEEAAELALSTADDSSLTNALEVLGSRLPPALAASAFEAIERKGQTSAAALLALFTASPEHLTPERGQKALREALWLRSEFARPLITQLHDMTNEQDWMAMLEAPLASLEVERGGGSGHSLGVLAEFLPPDLRQRELDAARRLESSRERARALLAFAGLTEGEARRDLLREALAAANTIDDAPAVVAALSMVVEDLDATLRARVLEHAWRSRGGREALLGIPALLRQLGPEQALELLQRPVQDDEHTWRDGLLTPLLDRAGPAVLRDLLAEVDPEKRPVLAANMAAALAIEDGADPAAGVRAVLDRIPAATARVEAICEVIPTVPPEARVELIGEVLAYVRDLEWHLAEEPPGEFGEDADTARQWILLGLIQDLPRAGQKAVLEATRSIVDPTIRSDTLTAIGPALAPEALPFALALILDLPEDRLQAQAISGLAAVVQGASLVEAQRAAESFDDEAAITIATVALIDHTPPETRLEVARRVITSVAAGERNESGAYHLRRLETGLALPLDDALAHRLVIAVLPSLPPAERSEALAVALWSIEPLSPEFRAVILDESVTRLCERGLPEEALALARHAPDPSDSFSHNHTVMRCEILATVGRSTGRTDVTTEALEAMLAAPARAWTGTLRRLGPTVADVPPPTLAPFVGRLLRQASAVDRATVLEVLGALSPAVVSLAGRGSLSDFSNDVLRVADWFP